MFFTGTLVLLQLLSQRKMDAFPMRLCLDCFVYRIPRFIMQMWSNLPR